MDNGLKPYLGYKKTELLWLDSVPTHWQLKKIKHLFTERVEKGYPEEPLLAATQTKGVVPKNLYENRTVTAEKDLHLLKIVKVGDFVISLRSFQGGIEYAYYQGIISPAYTVIVPNSEINRGYFRHLAKSRLFLELLKLCVTGIREGQNIDYNMLRDSDIPLPPKEEQDQIVRYLDNKLAKINKYIKSKKKLIELLKEQKQAIINQAVTKGLDPNAKLKPSGIDWLGDIPERWEVLKLKRVCEVNPSLNDYLNKYTSDGKVVFLPMEKISEYGVIDDSELRPISEVKNGLTGFAKNDVIIAKITPCFENGKGACLDDMQTNIGFGTTELIVLRPNKTTIPKFLYLITRTSYFRNLGKEVMTGSAGQKRVPVQFVSNFTVGLPDKKQQKDIVIYIETKTTAINKAIKRIKKEIDLIAEYRTSLISAVVTGKVDVQNIKVEDVIEEIEEDVEDLAEETLEEE